MFDVGFWEILIIGVVGMLVIGPERLPEVVRNVGKWVGKARRYIANVRRDFESELNSSDLRDLLGEQEAQIRELRGIVDETKRELSSSVDSLGRELESDVESESAPVSDAATVESWYPSSSKAGNVTTDSPPVDKPTDAT